MPKIKEIVDIINDNLRSCLTSKPFQKGKFEGIAELLTIMLDDGNKTVPCIVTNEGEANEVSVDDTYPFRLYHRIKTITNEDDGQFGDSIEVRESANMVMVVFGDRRAFQLRPEQLSSMINSCIPITLTNSQKTSLNLHTVAIQMSTTNLDSIQVFNQEYTGEVKYNLAPNYFLFEIPYVITTTYPTSCFDDCVSKISPQPTNCNPSVVRNSDSTYLKSLQCPDVLILEDVTYSISVNGVLQQYVVLPAGVNNTINITF